MNASDLKRRLELDTVAYWQLLGIEIHEVYGAGDVSLVVDMREQLATRLPDIMHGGAISSLIDSAAGAAVSTDTY